MDPLRLPYSNELTRFKQVEYMKKNSALYSAFLEVARLEAQNITPNAKKVGPAKDIRDCAIAFYKKFGEVTRDIPIVYNRDDRENNSNYGWLERWHTFVDLDFQKRMGEWADLKFLIDWVKNYEYTPTPSVRNETMLGRTKNRVGIKETTLKEAKKEFLDFFYNEIYYREKGYKAVELKKRRKKGNIRLYNWKAIDRFYTSRYDYNETYKRIEDMWEKERAAAKSKVRPQLKL